MANNYQIRSKEVQEVLRSFPKPYILWGNTFIIALFFIFLYALNDYRVPVTSQLPCKVISVSYDSLDDKIIVKAFINIPIPSDLKSHKPVNLILSQINNTRFDKIKAQISKITFQNNEIELVIQAQKNKTILTENSKLIYMANGMFGAISINLGSISLLELFINKMTNK